MLIIVVDGRRPIGAASLNSVDWQTTANGFTNNRTVSVRMSEEGFPTNFYILDDSGVVLNRGSLDNIERLDPDSGIDFSPGHLTITLVPLRGEEVALLSPECYFLPPPEK